MLSEWRDATSKIHLQWFAEKEAAGAAAVADPSADETSEDKAGEPEPGDSVSGANGKAGEKPTGPVSAEEFAKVKADYERIVGIFKAKEAKEKAQRDAALLKKGEYEKLYNEAQVELTETKPRLERMTAIVQAMLDAELQGLPKDFDKSLLPTGSVDVQLEWLLKAKKAKLFSVGTSSEETPARRPGDGTPPQRGAAGEGFLSIYAKRQ